MINLKNIDIKQLTLEIEVSKNGAVLIYAPDLLNKKNKKGVRLAMVGGSSQLNKIDLAFIKLFQSLKIEVNNFIFSKENLNFYFKQLNFEIKAMATIRNGTIIIILEKF